MAVDIKIPTTLWEDESEAVITNWLVADGSSVNEGQLIAEIMVEKVQHEIHAPASGTIKIGEPAEAVVKKDSTIGTIG